ncbi:hypothetical protein [Bradyrhizobium valentinum]|uniref:hypothetical protein n=1 Tax=Bradyrhizobium valentinum TaxID=1518501 RepID=UPI0007095EB2|nr:hypothetical protein [Bradyrhizobium valentinum]KRQ96397.1 hypothetical protein CQ10_31120 [Bradyrhizobium valentinum]
MAPFNKINPFDREFAAYNSTVQQPQQQQVDFAQHLDELPQMDAVNPDREFSISLRKTIASSKQRPMQPVIGGRRQAPSPSAFMIVIFANWLMCSSVLAKLLLCSMTSRCSIALNGCFRKTR